MDAAYVVAILPTVLIALAGNPTSAQTQTCFRACLASKVKQSDVTDDMIRFQMTQCRDACDDESRAKAVQLGLDRKIAGCEPQPVSDAEFKALRAASASFLTYANSFTWDVHNILPGKVIRKVEIAYPTLDLDETIATGGGIVLPGETATMLINGVFEGYPAMRYGMKVRALYACSID
ncbi:MAG: hypothetical protein ACHQAY_14295 [Hyphomicrobiales bacterium]